MLARSSSGLCRRLEDSIAADMLQREERVVLVVAVNVQQKETTTACIAVCGLRVAYDTKLARLLLKEKSLRKTFSYKQNHVLYTTRLHWTWLYFLPPARSTR